MGLDMYLKGQKYFWSGDGQPKEDGFRVTEHILELGYWRKHPNLHGYIVQEFADGEDNCEEIELNDEDIVKIMAAVKGGDLPHTEGFFFGRSDGNEKEGDLEIFQRALDWMNTEEKGVIRTVVYRASW
jgi:hypothetical protein